MSCRWKNRKKLIERRPVLVIVGCEGVEKAEKWKQVPGLVTRMARASMQGDMAESGVLGGNQTVGGDIEAFVIMIDPETWFVIH
jgi:hypothetical protein